MRTSLGDVCRRCVPLGEVVSSREKEVSFFELHADQHNQGFLCCATNRDYFKTDGPLVCSLAIWFDSPPCSPNPLDTDLPGTFQRLQLQHRVECILISTRCRYSCWKPSRATAIAQPAGPTQWISQAIFLEQNRFAVIKPELNGIIGTRTISIYHADVSPPL